MSTTNESTATGTRPPNPTGRLRKAGLMLIVVMAVLASSVWGVGRWRYAATHVSTENASVDGHIVPVLAKVGGYVEQVLIEENQNVARGETLVTIDESELRIRLAEAEADLAIARAEAGGEGMTGQAQALASAARERRLALEARLRAAQAHQDRAARDLVRVEELAAKLIVSRQQLDAARAASDAATADVSALEQEVAAARSAERAAAATGRAADARLARAQAIADASRMDLGYARVAAPIAGVVSERRVEVGQLVQPGQPLAAVVGDSAIWITANLKETETAEIRQGQQVAIEVDAYPGCTAVGTVESVSPATGSKFALIAPDNATGNFTKVIQLIPTRIAVREGCGTDRPLRPGMSVVVHIDVR